MPAPSNYPPGVTGNEPEIAGYPDCANCGHEAEAHGDEPDEHGYGAMRCNEPGCDCAEYDQYGEEIE